jgi:hypothetical protein
MPYWHCFLVERREDPLVGIHLLLLLEVLKRRGPVKVPPLSLPKTHMRENERERERGCLIPLRMMSLATFAPQKWNSWLVNNLVSTLPRCLSLMSISAK